MTSPDMPQIGPGSPDDFPARGVMAFGLAVLGLLLAFMGGWAGFATISGAVIAPGVVEVEDRGQVIQHPDGGAVAAILVRDGDAVFPGQVLLRLDGTALTSERAMVTAEREELAARRARLEAERVEAIEPVFPAALTAAARHDPATAARIAGQRDLFAARTDTQRQILAQVDRRRDQTRAQIAGIAAQDTALRQQQALIEEELTGLRSLRDRGLAQAGRVLALEREAAGISGRRGELAAARAQAEGRITELDLEQLRLGSERREAAETELRDIVIRESQLAERHHALSAQIARLDLRAPVAGIVNALALTTPRGVIRPAETVLTIVPQNRPQIIAARVPPDSIDSVYPGQPVTLRFPALPPRTTTDATGHVTRISADTLTDETRNSFYRVEITLAQNIPATALPDRLLPGMRAEVFLETAPHSPLAWLLHPFTAYFDRALREP